MGSLSSPSSLAVLDGLDGYRVPGFGSIVMMWSIRTDATLLPLQPTLARYFMGDGDGLSGLSGLVGLFA